MSEDYPRTVNPNFRDWACSLSGCDGGDPSAPIWISGIEWGYSKGNSQSNEEYEVAITHYYVDELPEEISKGKYTPEAKYDWDQSFGYPFGISAAPLIHV